MGLYYNRGGYRKFRNGAVAVAAAAAARGQARHLVNWKI